MCHDDPMEKGTATHSMGCIDSDTTEQLALHKDKMWCSQNGQGVAPNHLNQSFLKMLQDISHNEINTQPY